jgi:hypothetical protein
VHPEQMRPQAPLHKAFIEDALGLTRRYLGCSLECG